MEKSPKSVRNTSGIFLANLPAPGRPTNADAKPANTSGPLAPVVNLADFRKPTPAPAS